jgi:hypothetical protein
VLLVLAYLRKGETFAELAAGLGIGTTTAWRYVTETVGRLAARSPKRPPTAPTPSCEASANPPTFSSRPGASCANRRLCFYPDSASVGSAGSSVLFS